MSSLSLVLQPNELVQTVFDSLSERICVVDRDGWICLTNEAWEQCARQNGANLSRCGPGVNYLGVCRTARGPSAEHALDAAAGIETVLRGATAQFVLDYPCHSSSRKAWFRLVARPLCRPHTGAVVQHRDITSQVILAGKLRSTQFHYGALWENPADVATIMTAEGVIQYQSPASESVLGKTPEELAGRSIFDFIHPEDESAVRKLLRECLRHARRKHPCEFRFRDSDGSWRMLEGIARQLLADTGGSIILNSRDITHRKLAEQALLAEHRALARGRDDLEALAARLLREQEEQRRWAASELNGNLSQRLAQMSFQAAHMPPGAPGGAETYDLRESIAGLGRDLRRLSDVLYPAMLEHFGLAVALRDYCAEFKRESGIPVACIYRGISTRLPGSTAVTLYRVAEAALANVARHAHATHVSVSLSRIAKGIRLVIRDDGAGFDPAALEPGFGLGILGMRERLRAVNGSLFIRSKAGVGTEVLALIREGAAGPDPALQG